MLLKTEIKAPNVSYYANKETKCPICKAEFHQELLHSGGKRLISSIITPELRRLYKPSAKYGRIWPQVYSIMTCPKCLYSSFPNDFTDLGLTEIKDMEDSRDKRENYIKKIWGLLSFQEKRSLASGAASYLLALDCYQKRGTQIGPTPKKALCSLRGAWLLADLAEEFPTKGFEKICRFLYFKAARYYALAVDVIQSKREPSVRFLNLLGPDIDKNWGFEGTLYLNSYLNCKYGKMLASNDDECREIYEKARRSLSRLYGFGKSSYTKPSLLVEYARTLHEKITDDLETLCEPSP